MKTLIIWLASFLLAGIIISPFFWLKFLKEKNKWLYVFLSIISSSVFYMLYIFKLGNFTLNIAAKIGTDFYYFYYDVSGNALIIIFFAILISPFFLTKSIFQKFSIKWFFISSGIAILILIVYVIIFVYVIFPMTAGVIFKNLN